MSNTTLTSMSLSSNNQNKMNFHENNGVLFIAECGLDKEGIAVLSEYLKVSHTLVRLSLSGVQLSNSREHFLKTM